MRNDAKIYAKEQQIKLIDSILCNLCSIELNSDGRKYLKKIKEKIQKDLDLIREMEKERTEKYTGSSFLKYRFRLPDSQSFR